MTNEDTVEAHLGEQRNVTVGSLRVDAENPRLAGKFRDLSHMKLLPIMVLGHETFAVAESFADNGYFMSEPLLVIADPDEDDSWIVVEGNRRTTALVGLTNVEARKTFPDADKWDKLAARCPITAQDLIPVVVHESREAAQIQLGSTHMDGKLDWSPHAQATYVANRVDEGMSFDEVAKLIGIKRTDVRDHYRDYALARQARELGYLSERNIERKFSLLTVAARNPNLRSHVGVPAGSLLQPGVAPVPSDKTEQFEELLTWIFGSDDEETGKVITESRDIQNVLGKVVASDVGIASLRSGESLEQAAQKLKEEGMPARERIISFLTTSKRALQKASAEDFSSVATDSEVEALMTDIESAASALRGIIEDRGGNTD